MLYIIQTNYTKYTNVNLVSFKTKTEYSQIEEESILISFSLKHAISMNYNEIIIKGIKIPSNIFKSLIIQLSYLRHSFDNLVKIYGLKKGSANFNNSIKLLVNVNEFIRNEIIDINKFKLTEIEIDEIKYILDKLPYLYICNVYKHLHTFTYESYIEFIINKLNLSSLSITKELDYNKSNSILFDDKYYLSLYPIHKNGFKNNKEMFDNYKIHGIKENKIPNELICKINSTFYEIKTINELKLFNSNELKLFNSSSRSDSIQSTFIILTRTHNRKNKFYQTLESINSNLNSNSNINIIHYVSYDNEETNEYVTNINLNSFSNLNSKSKLNSNIYSLRLINLTGTKLHPNEYIDEFYKRIIKDNVKGWILVLDDDDLITTPNLFKNISNYLVNENKLIIWKLHRPDKYIYPKDLNNIKVGEIATCSYLYHSSYIKLGHWGASGIGDFDFFQYLYLINNKEKDKKKLEIIFLNYPLTRINYDNEISGWSWVGAVHN